MIPRWFRRRKTDDSSAVLRYRQELVNNISRTVERIEASRKAEGRKLGQGDVEAIKMIGRRIAQDRWPS